jgi:quercetin dioxygenase-like cupin family protein
MAQEPTRGRIMLGAAALLTLALLAALIAAALSARAEHGGAQGVTFDWKVGNPAEANPGNVFIDDVRTQFRIKLAPEPGGMRQTHVVNLHDSNYVMVAEATFEPGAHLDWHSHPGPVIVAIKQGALTVTFAEDCVARTYEEGYAWVDFGRVHKAENLLTDEDTVFHLTFLGAELPPTVFLDPADHPDC